MASLSINKKKNFAAPALHNKNAVKLLYTNIRSPCIYSDKGIAQFYANSLSCLMPV